MNRRFYLILLLLLAMACKRETREPVIGVAYVASSSANLRDRLGPAQITVATLKFGDRLEILQRRRRWIRARIPSNQEGWIEERHLVTQEIIDLFHNLRKSAAEKP